MREREGERGLHLADQPHGALLGGSWVIINGVISRVTIHIRGLITPLISTNEPPSTSRSEQDRVQEKVEAIRAPASAISAERLFF